MRIRLLVMAAVAALLMAACAGSTATDDAADVVASASTSDQGQTGDDAAPVAEAGDDENAGVTQDEPAEEEIVRTDDEETVNDAFVSPVFDALGFDPNDRQEARDEFVANAEELVRQCMAESGFEYVPSIPTFAPSFGRQLELNESISPQQFTAEYGYGISTLLELDFMEEGVLAFVELLLGPPPTEARSEGEQAAYELALSGETIQGLSAEDAQEQAFENFGGQDGSCRDYGYSTADNSVGEKFDGLFTLLGDEYEAIFEKVENDPRIRDANAAWQTCMAEFGYSYENSQEIVDELLASGNDLRTGFQSSPEALAVFAAAGQANLAAMDADSRFNFLEENGAFQGFAMVPSLQVELDELIELELAVAGHDSDCANEELYREVQLEFEQEFVEQHAEQLELIASGEA